MLSSASYWRGYQVDGLPRQYTLVPGPPRTTTPRFAHHKNRRIGSTAVRVTPESAGDVPAGVANGVVQSEYVRDASGWPADRAIYIYK